MKLRKFILVALICSISLTSTGCWVLWAKYKNREKGFSILLPRFWKRVEGEQHTIIMAKAPLRGKNDEFQENINVIVSDLPAIVDIEIFAEMNQKQAAAVLPGPKVDFESGEIFAGLNRGRWFAFTSISEPVATRVMSAIWMKGTRVYVVSCSAEADLFYKYEPTFLHVMESLRY